MALSPLRPLIFSLEFSPAFFSMFDIRKLFAKEAPSPARTDAEISSAVMDGGSGEGLESEYQRLIAAQFRRLGIAEDCVTIEVRRLGHGPHGFDVLVGMVRLHHWERTSGLRLLMGLPLIESRVRKLVRSTWLADYSHFGGLWVHASEHLHEAPGMDELRELLLTLTPPDAPASEGKSPAHPFAHSGTVSSASSGSSVRAVAPQPPIA